MPGHTWLPIDLCDLAIQQHMVKPLRLYLYLKMHTSGKCHKNSDVFSHLKTELSIKSNRTVQKQMLLLLERDWMGYNPKSGYYFIRNYRRLLPEKNRKYLACRVEVKDLKNFQAFLTGVILCDNVRRQKCYWENQKKRRPAAASKGEIANQLGLSSDAPEYYGLSNKALGRMLGCKQTRACVLKQQAEKSEYISVRHKFKIIKTLPKKDYMIREQLYEEFPGLRGRLHFRKKKEKKKWVVHLLQQTQDEIIPKMLFGIIKK